jgi:polar amino acid transport system substrate-binding protein
MSSPCNKGRATAAALVLAASIGATVPMHRAAAAVLNVCVDEANPTWAMDARVARAAAMSQGDSVKLARFAGYGRGGEGLPPARFAKMAQSDCDLIMGFPVDVSDPHLPPDVKATSAYAGTGFIVVRRRGSADTALGELPDGTAVGIAELDTYAGLLFQSHPNLVMHVYPKDSLMLEALHAHRIAAGVAWQAAIEHAGLGRAPVSIAMVADQAAGPEAGTKKGRRKAPALYTQDQATKGALAYYQNCAMCHAPLLDGQAAGYAGPALKGREFADPSYDFRISDIFNFVAKLMPAATPGSLTREQDVQIMAFILQQNGYPAGPDELVYEAAEKSRVLMRYYGK